MKLTDQQIERLAAKRYALSNSPGGTDADERALIYEFHHDLNTAKRRAEIFALREVLRDAMVLASE